jgi:hypothetical protein
MMIIFTSCSLTDSNSDHVSNTKYSAQADFSFEVDVAQRTMLELDAVNGPAKVYGKAGLETVQIYGKRIVESDSKEDAQEHLTQLNVNLYEEKERLLLQTEQPEQSQGRNYIVQYTIYIPSDWDLTIYHVNGQIDLDSLTADLKVYLVNGLVQLHNVAANLCIELTNGNISGDFSLPHMGSCCIKTVNGQIDLDIPHTTSADFSASIVNGSIGVYNLQLHEIQSTPKYLSGRLGAGAGSMELHAVNGTIYVTGN